MLAQKYAAESTSEQAGSSSEGTTHSGQLHHNMQQFYAYSPLVSSSCGGSQYESAILDTNGAHNDVIHVESTSSQMESEDSQLMPSQFHENMIDNLIKQEGRNMASTLVSSTSAANLARHDMIFDCNSDAVDSTTSNGHHLSYGHSMHTYHEPIDKMSMQSLMQTTDSHHLLQTHFLHQSSTNELSMLPQSVEQCLQPLQESVQHTSTALEPEVPQENVINDLPVLSRARASLPAEYLYIEEPTNTAVLGVFAKKTIPKRTQFGPVEGVIVTHSHSNMQNINHNLLIFITETLILDQSDENQSNWMKFVRSADSAEEQNLALVSKEQVSGNEIEIKFFFLTTRTIYAREELKVWYSKEYAEKFNLKMLEPRAQMMVEFEEQSIEGTALMNRNTNPIDIVATGGHKLRNKIAKSQQMQQQLQKQENLENNNQTQVNSSSKSTKDSETQPKYQCETCQKVFPRFYSLRRHQIMHSGMDQRSQSDINCFCLLF